MNLNKGALFCAVVLVGVVLGQQMAIERLSAHNELLARDYQDAILSDNRMTRSRTNFELPRMGPDELRAITEVARALAWPWEVIAAAEKAENGGMRLELGIQRIPDDIRKNFPPFMWQRAAGARIMQEEAGKMILDDPDVTFVFAARLARRWKAVDVSGWRDQFIAALNKWRGEGEVVRPDTPKKKPKAGRRKRK